MTNEVTARDYTVPAADRVIRILKYLRDNKGAGVSQIAAAVGIGRSNCYAILKTLQGDNFVAFDNGQKTYSLGLGLLEIARAATRDVPVVAAARTFLVSFAQRTELSIFLIGPFGEDRLIVLDKEEPPVDVRITISIGTTTAVTSGASGKCFMAFLPHVEAEHLLGHVPIPPMTASTVTTKKEFLAGLKRTRKDGYAIVFDEAIAGANGIAAPIFDASGRVAFVVTIVGVALNLPREKAHAVGKELRAATDQITAQTGGCVPESLSASSRR